MNPRVVSVAPNETLSLAAQTMLWMGLRHLPVVEGQRLIGILSERDILRHRAEIDGIDGSVKDAMSEPAQFAHPDDAAAEAAERLAARKIGCLPVIEHGKLVGMLTTTDMLAMQFRQAFEAPPRAGEARVEDVMTKDPLTTHPEELLFDAVAKMVKNNVRHLPVVDGDRKLRGFLSDRDLTLPVAMEFLKGNGEETKRVQSVMTTDVATISPKAFLTELLPAFAGWRFQAFPVVDEAGILLGIVSYVDILSLYAREQR
jgi:CBS domain-containing protein